MEFYVYTDKGLNWLISVILLLVLCIFLVLPLALLSFFESDHVAKTVVVVVMCVLVSFLTRAIEPNEGRQIILVCGYSAIMSGFLAQS